MSAQFRTTPMSARVETELAELSLVFWSRAHNRYPFQRLAIA
jgi:hypothetical protein